MLNLQNQGALVERFAVAKPDYILHAEKVARTNAVQHENDLAGQKSGSVESIQLSSAAASKNAQDANGDKVEKAAKQRAADMLLQALLDQIAAIDADIDELQEQIDALQAKIDILSETLEALQNGADVDQTMLGTPEVAEAILDWEHKTGKKFDPDADNASDILAAILGSQIDEFGNDLASLNVDIGTLVNKRDALVAEVDKINDHELAGVSVPVLETEVDTASQSYAASKTTANLINNDGLSERATGHEDGKTDLEVDNQETVALNEDGFGGFGATLELASQDVQNQFQTASLQPSDPESIEPAIENAPEIGMQA